MAPNMNIMFSHCRTLRKWSSLGSCGLSLYDVLLVSMIFFVFRFLTALIFHVKGLADALEDIVLAVNGLAPELPA